MRFSWKVFFLTLMVIAVASVTSGYFLIASVFQADLDREIRVAQEGSQLLRYSFETAVGSLPSDYDSLNKNTVREIARSLIASDLGQNRWIRITDSEHEVLYTNKETEFDSGLLSQVSQQQQGYRVFQQEGRYYLQTACMPYVEGHSLYLESFRDISSIFDQRSHNYDIYRLMVVAVLMISGFAVFFLTRWLTRPIQELAHTARQLTQGQYDKRARIHSSDEVGALAKDFNTMADVLEKRMRELEDAARRQEDFVGSFAHEMKTPLTSIIGYADMLRSRQLPQEQQFEAVNYIFNEGKRLEALALKMMDLIVLQKQDFAFVTLRAPALLKSAAVVVDAMLKQSSIKLDIEAEDAPVFCEPDLIKTLLINLLDNARKATPENGRISLEGMRHGKDYLIRVKDTGCGIPEEVLPRIMEAFYMADKSRARANGGAGLGLAICERIAVLHGTKLEFESSPGKGTTVQFYLKGEKDEPKA